MRIGLDSDSEIESIDGEQQLKTTTLPIELQAPKSIHSNSIRTSLKGKARQLDSDQGQELNLSPIPILNDVERERKPTRRSSSKVFIPPWIARQQRRQKRSGNKRIDTSSPVQSNYNDTDSQSESSSDSDSTDDDSEDQPDLDSDSSNDSDAASNSETDSEEEQWPVNPNRSRHGGAQDRQKRNRKKKDEEVVRRLIRLQSSSVDPSELPGRATRTYEKASKNYTARLRGLSLAPSDSQQPPRQATPAGREREASEARAWLAQKELDEVNGILEGLQIRAKEDERKEEAAFEERQRTLWKSVEDAIRAAEKERDDALAVQAAQLAAARKAQEERERQAREARVAEERRIAEERRVAEEAERRRAEEEEREAARAREEQTGGGLSLKRDAKIEWEKWSEVMKNIKDKVLPYVSSNNDLRKQCFAAKRQITPKIGQLTNSRSEIERITIAISEVLTSARNVATPSGQSEVYVWILNHLSKCLIRQAEQEVAVKQDTAFPLARVVRWLIDGGHDKLAEILMARLVKKCPWVLGFCPERKASDNDEKYAKMLGKSNSSENSVQYSGRMAGILAFYFAVVQSERTQPPAPLSPISDPFQVPINFRPSILWTWQSRAVTPPLTNHGLLPTLWCCFLEVAGPRALNIYGKQSEKVWKLLLVKGIREGKAEFCQDETAKPAVARLTIILEGWEKNGQVKEATGGREMEP